MELNYSIIPLRPAGAAWSSVRDMLKYVQMELARGHAAGRHGATSSKEPLLARRAPQVPIGKDATYGMGLMVDTDVRRAGRAPRRRHDRLPQRHDVAAGARRGRGGPHQRRSGLGHSRRIPAQAARGAVRRPARGRRQVAAAAKAFYEQLAAERKLLTVPADAAEAAKLAARYANDALGEIAVTRGQADDGVRLRRVEERGRVAQEPRRHGVVPHDRAGGRSGSSSSWGPARKRTLVMRDAQHEYVFTETT